LAQDIQPGPIAELVRQASIGIYKWGGWQAIREVEPPRKAVIIAAPHTSNWDFAIFFGLCNSLGIQSHWMAKESLFRWPLGPVLRSMGGIPVNRSKSQNMVEQMVAEFNRRDDFLLTVPPEGTRGNVRRWRTGFYYIALGAKVPLMCALMDYKKRLGGLGPYFMPTGDYAADMRRIGEYYFSVTPKYPERRVTIDAIRSED
jgi:1-acyl-sn-glycerol-3-phosphate acyltransferase